jgi:hypothetical protein
MYQRVPTTYPDDAFVDRGRFRKLIIIGLAVMDPARRGGVRQCLRE